MILIIKPQAEDSIPLHPQEVKLLIVQGKRDTDPSNRRTGLSCTRNSVGDSILLRIR